LPAPSDGYFEIETAKLHGGWSQWDRLDPQEKGRLMAHEMVKNMREHYHFDKRTAAGEKNVEKPKGTAPWDMIKNRFFGGAPK